MGGCSGIFLKNTTFAERQVPRLAALGEDLERVSRVGHCLTGGCSGNFENRLRREPSPAALGEDPERVPRVGRCLTGGCSGIFF
jgi:hypothetical protein